MNAFLKYNNFLDEKHCEFYDKLYDIVISIFHKNGCDVEKIDIKLGEAMDDPMYMYVGYIILATEHRHFYLGQFVYQVAHELAHAYIHQHYGPYVLPDKIRWFEELLAANISFFALEEISNLRNDIYDFKNYLITFSAKKNNIFWTLLKDIISTNLSFYEDNEYAVYSDPVRELSVVFYFNKKYEIWDLLKLFADAVCAIPKNNFSADIFTLKQTMIEIATDKDKHIVDLLNSIF